jgi:predicted phosphodiesterase
MTKLYAISDLHLGHEINRRALLQIKPCPEDWLILAGDVGETLSHVRFAFSILVERFAKVVWVPGNHELWTLPSGAERLRGLRKYEQLVALSGSYGVLTPEDPYPVVRFSEETVRIVPLFLLYDYSFRPPDVPLERAVEWAAETDVLCADEILLHAEPYAGRAQWCHERCRETEKRLGLYHDGIPTVLINHFPLRESLVTLPSIPRFSLWCGTRITDDWHKRFNARVVVFGHLHMRSSTHCDGVRFEEVSLGYPSQWVDRLTIQDCLRQILPERRS